jgi:hypothetical protein
VQVRCPRCSPNKNSAAREHARTDTQTVFCEDRCRSARLAGSTTAMSKVTMGHDHLQPVSNTGGAGDLMGSWYYQISSYARSRICRGIAVHKFA